MQLEAAYIPANLAMQLEAVDRRAGVGPDLASERSERTPDVHLHLARPGAVAAFGHHGPALASDVAIEIRQVIGFENGEDLLAAANNTNGGVARPVLRVVEGVPALVLEDRFVGAFKLRLLRQVFVALRRVPRCRKWQKHCNSCHHHGTHVFQRTQKGPVSNGTGTSLTCLGKGWGHRMQCI